MQGRGHHSTQSVRMPSRGETWRVKFLSKRMRMEMLNYVLWIMIQRRSYSAGGAQGHQGANVPARGAAMEADVTYEEQYYGEAYGLEELKEKSINFLYTIPLTLFSFLYFCYNWMSFI